MRVSLKRDVRESALLRQVRLIIQSRPSAAHCYFVFVSLRTPGANHKCARYRPGDGPFKAKFERIEAAGLAAGTERGAEHLGGLAEERRRKLVSGLLDRPMGTLILPAV